MVTILDPQSAQYLALAQSVSSKPLAGEFYANNPKYADAVLDCMMDRLAERLVQE
jgi:hypothetical protein